MEEATDGFMTEERRLIQEAARRFAHEEVLPVANRLDPLHEDIPMELRAKMGELGFFGILIPKEYGGLGLGVFEYCLVAEELARGWMSVASLIARGNGIGGHAVPQTGNPGRKIVIETGHQKLAQLRRDPVQPRQKVDQSQQHQGAHNRFG